MKKLTVILSTFVFLQQLSAQQYLVPFTQGNKQGLADNKGKTVLAARYDDINWVSDKYFETTTRIRLDDTVEVKPRQFLIRHEDSKVTGIIYNGKEILKDEPFEDYYVLPKKFILAKTEKRVGRQTASQIKKYKGREKFSSVFSLDGKNLYPDNFRRIQVVDTTGERKTYPGYSKYVLLSVEDFDNKYSLFVFDADRQLISEWLLKNITDLRQQREGYFSRSSTKQFTYTDENYQHRIATIQASGGRFVLTSAEKPAPVSRRSDDVEVTDNPYSLGLDAVPTEREGPIEEIQKRVVRKIIPYYQKINDTLFFINEDAQKTRVDTAAFKMIYFAAGKYITQPSVLFKQNERFGLHQNNRAQLLPYDSMAYFGPHYFVGKKENGRWKYGVVSKTDSIIIPLVYDSIQQTKMLVYGDRKEANGYFKTVNQSERYSYSAKPYKPYSIEYGGLLNVYKGGKMGLLTTGNDLLLPVDYEAIWNNGFNYIQPRKSEFYILKKDGKYGAVVSTYDTKTKKQSFETILPVQHKAIPLFYYPDYYGIKGLKIFGLVDQNGDITGYVR